MCENGRADVSWTTAIVAESSVDGSPLE